MTTSSSTWQRLCGCRDELSIGLALRCGQAFGWKQLEATAFVGTVNDTAVALRTAPNGATEYRVLHAPSRSFASTRDLLSDYFQLSTKLKPLYEQWAAADPRMQTAAAALAGLRVIRQPPFECLISFICSSNNNIARITSMLSSLRLRYGTKLTHHDGDPIHAFPTLDQLQPVTEQELRDLGFGYRAKFIVKTVDALKAAGGEAYLQSLRTKSSQVLWCIAVRDYDRSLAAMKSLTPRVYDRVGSLFRQRFGDHAGWAHSVLFAAELPVFAPLLPSHFVDANAAFRTETKMKKKALAKKKDSSGGGEAIKRKKQGKANANAKSTRAGGGGGGGDGGGRASRNNGKKQTSKERASEEGTRARGQSTETGGGRGGRKKKGVEHRTAQAVASPVSVHDRPDDKPSGREKKRRARAPASAKKSAKKSAKTTTHHAQQQPTSSNRNDEHHKNHNSNKNRNSNKNHASPSTSAGATTVQRRRRDGGEGRWKRRSPRLASTSTT
ncbi:OGG1 protein type 2c [Salpingoeca rosetta]|uniref:DNA-(apurinic or apyrimidinic site) lyase n=1 Tax=Salpingoeca rosetta (strain ATCC 50818 / BSB-021) TaxID=946362 RepID=F2UB62_SALR5|nr:OGG1 protein type 2c [Salpingoeca rosetta]EGD74075.1 OGG1 protein type 2c [Salpingoeca rosetta]|eukprot:XP_004993637.1 OGG1 protein type 2c [Salpingoeca rosetta]